MEIIKNGFKNERLGIELDVYLIQYREWFRAKDISDFLGYQDTNKMMRSIETTKFNCIRQTLSGANNNKYEADFINESALYEIIFSITRRDMTRYNKAREFQKWVFEEVLPSIRKNNFYVDEKNINDEQTEKLKNYLFELCDMGKVSIGRASQKIFGNKSELKKRLVNLGWVDFDNCTFKQQQFKNSRGDMYDLFVVNMSGKYDEGKAKHSLQVSITNAGYIYLKNLFETFPNKGGDK